MAYQLTKILTVLLVVSTTYLNVSAERKYFDKSKDLLLGQFDLKPDEDDVHAAAALACMLKHSDLDGINYYVVAGAYGTQNSPFITAGIPDFYNLLFGQKNTYWTDAHNEWEASVTRVKDMARPILQAGGKVFVQEAGESDFSYDVCQALLSDGIDASTLASSFIIVQHNSTFNEVNTTQSELTWLKSNIDYYLIDDGNVPSNTTDEGRDHGQWDTPQYKSHDSNFLNNAKAANNPNTNARDYWTAADDICDNWHQGWQNPAINEDGGVDFSDCVENWWIFNIGDDASTVEKFWSRYVLNNTGSPVVNITSPKNGASLEKGVNIVIEATAIDTDGTVTQVEFFKNGASLGVDDASPYEITLTNPSEGEHEISIAATDNEGKIGTAKVTVSFLDYAPCGEKTILTSYNNFPDFNISGFKPAYKDDGRQCLAINAAQYKDEYAAAKTTYSGPSGKFNIKINTLLEYDGESTYKIKINNVLVGTYQNPRTDEAGDLTPSDTTIEKIDIQTGDIIQVEFNSHSNGLIPEDGAFAFSRGRWKSIELIKLCLGGGAGENEDEGCKSVWEEKDGILIIEAEEASKLGEGWEISTDRTGFTGEGYLEYEGSSSMGSPNPKSLITYDIKINTPGTYQFKWHSRNGAGASKADEENDSWLMIEADDFYGLKDGNRVYAKDHYIKVWIQNLTAWSWACWGEHGVNGFDIFATFNEPGVYSINIAGRSNGHPVDRFALYLVNKESTAINLSTPLSETTEVGCSNNYVLVEEITVPNNELTINAGSEKTIKATVNPQNASNKKLVITSSDSTIASIDGYKIVAKKSGVVAVTVASEENQSINQIITVVVVVETSGQSKLTEIVYSNVVSISSDSDGANKTGEVLSKDFAVDGDPTTMWHTQWLPSQKPLPHYISFDLGDTVTIDTIDYLPRQDAYGPNGTVGQYEVFVSNDTLNWGTAVASGTFLYPDNYLTKQSIGLPESTAGRFVKFVALTEAQNSGVTTTSMAEMIFKTSVKGVEISVSTLNLSAGTSGDITAKAIPLNDPEKYPVTWSSTNEAIATVSNGSISAIKSGFTYVVATILDGMFADSCLVIVNNPGDTLVSIFQEEMAIRKDNTVQLRAMVIPDSYTIEWKSLSEGVATVSSSGLVTAHAKGEAAIVASIDDDAFADTLNLSVIDPIIKIDKEYDSLWAGDVKEVVYMVSPSDEEVIWASLNSEVATVNYGVIIAKTKGDVNIVAKIANSEISDTLKLSVLKPTVSISTTKADLLVGDSINLSATANPDTYTIIWKSLNAEIASVSTGGKVKTLLPGVALISASILEGNYQALCAVNVNIPTVKISGNKHILPIESTLTLTAATKPKMYEIAWQSTDNSIAAISQDGLVTAISDGEVDIIASIHNGLYVDNYQIKVFIPEINITKDSETVPVRGSKTLKFTSNPSDEEVTWESSDNAIASVSASGKVEGIKKGSVTITASIFDGKYTDECTVEVEEDVSIDEVDVNSFSLYPNPTNGIVYVSGEQSITLLRIIDIKGKTIKEESLPNHMFDVSELRNGMYLIQLIYDDKIVSKLLLKKND